MALVDGRKKRQGRSSERKSAAFPRNGRKSWQRASPTVALFDGRKKRQGRSSERKSADRKNGGPRYGNALGNDIPAKSRRKRKMRASRRYGWRISAVSGPPSFVSGPTEYETPTRICHPERSPVKDLHLLFLSHALPKNKCRSSLKSVQDDSAEGRAKRWAGLRVGFRGAEHFSRAE